MFTLTGRVIFNHQNSVDTPVTISMIWSSSGGLLEATSQTDDYSLTFQPIATNSSGTFILTVTIQPSDNSEFIVGSSGNASYNLVVRGKSRMIEVKIMESYLAARSAFLQLFPYDLQILPLYHVMNWMTVERS